MRLVGGATAYRPPIRKLPFSLPQSSIPFSTPGKFRFPNPPPPPDYPASRQQALFGGEGKRRIRRLRAHRSIARPAPTVRRRRGALHLYPLLLPPPGTCTWHISILLYAHQKYILLPFLCVIWIHNLARELIIQRFFV